MEAYSSAEAGMYLMPKSWLSKGDAKERPGARQLEGRSKEGRRWEEEGKSKDDEEAPPTPLSLTLVVIDYATQYPGAMPLRTASAEGVAQELAVLFTRVGGVKQIVTDQGTVFMGKTLQALSQLVEVQMLHTTVYHPQTNGLVGRFNGTLK